MNREADEEEKIENLIIAKHEWIKRRKIVFNFPIICNNIEQLISEITQKMKYYGLKHSDILDKDGNIVGRITPTYLDDNFKAITEFGSAYSGNFQIEETDPDFDKWLTDEMKKDLFADSSEFLFKYALYVLIFNFDIYKDAMFYKIIK